MHVCDREGDSYVLINKILKHGHDLVIRDSFNRRVVTTTGTSLVLDAIENQEVLGKIVVDVPARKRQPSRPKEKKRKDRSQRQAKLELRAISVRIQRPASVSDELPAELSLGFVMAKEIRAPSNEDPIDWRVWTTLPIESVDHVTRVLNIYKARWRIEELFKALKTGCGFGSTRFESRDTSARALALHLPIAVGLLRLRAVSDAEKESPASSVVDDTQLAVLRAVDKKLPQEPTAADVMWAIARMGGWLPQNKRAGWIVLGRGYAMLLTMSLAWKLARGETPSPLEHAAAQM